MTQLADTIQHLVPWLDHLTKAPSIEALRTALQQRYPAFNPKQLKNLIIIGAAEEGQRLADICETLGIKVIAICDDNPEKQNLTIQNCSVQPISSLTNVDKNIPVIIASHRVLKPFLRLRKMGFEHVAPFAILQVLDANLFPPHMFYTGWLEDLFNHRTEYNKLVSLFSDDMSRSVLNAVLGFRLTLDPEVLSPIVEWDLYGPNALLTYSDNEVYIDGGTFDGDTIRLFIDRVNHKFDKIYGFEPDTNTFQKLKGNFAHEPRVFPINKGLYSHGTTLHFDNVGTRGSILTEEKGSGIDVPVISIDEVLGTERVTYIKMNIEGAEIPALQGASKAIARCAPKLAISVYHRPTDLWEIPFLVRTLHKDYDLYLRQHDGGVIETVLYALPKVSF